MSILKHDGNKVVVSSATDARRHYVVTKKGGKWTCSCPAWIYSKGHKARCKHIRLVAGAA